MGASINIEALDEGFLVEDDSGKKTAIASAEQLIRRIKAHFGLTRTDSGYVKVGDRASKIAPPARESSASAEEKLVCPPALKGMAKDAVVCLRSDDVEGLATSGFDSPDTPFLFKECEPFKWFNLPTFRAGKTMYHLLQGKVHIMREGYSSGVQVWAALDDLKRLRELEPTELKKALVGLHKGRQPLLTGFLRDVEFSKIGVKADEGKPQLPEDGDEAAPEPKPPSERTRKLQEIARNNVERWKAEHGEGGT